MLIFAFTGDKKIYIKLCNPGETVTSAIYVAFIHSMGEHRKKLRTSPTKLKDLWFQHDNARAHAAQNTREFLKRRNYCDRWVFRDLKKHLRKTDFSSSDKIKTETLQWFKQLPEDVFSHEQSKLLEHCKAVINFHGDYVV